MAGARKKGYKAPDKTFTVLERWAFLTDMKIKAKNIFQMGWPWTPKVSLKFRFRWDPNDPSALR